MITLFLLRALDTPILDLSLLQVAGLFVAAVVLYVCLYYAWMFLWSAYDRFFLKRYRKNNPSNTVTFDDVADELLAGIIEDVG